MKIRAADLPSSIRIEVRHLTDATHKTEKRLISSDPRTCPVALALREATYRYTGEWPNDTAMYSFYSEIVLANGQTFHASHTDSVLEFIRGQDDRWHGEAPLGVYEFNWLPIVKRRRRTKDITELIGS